MELGTPEVISLLEDKKKLLAYLIKQCEYICTSRPTAVNIKKESESLIELCKEWADNEKITFDEMRQNVISFAAKMLDTDIATNKAIGDHGAKHIANNAKMLDGQFVLLTHCNTGSLATAGYGTALGVIRSLFQMGKLQHAVSEFRASKVVKINESQLSAYAGIFI